MYRAETTSQGRTRLLVGGGLRDATGRHAAPGAVAVRDGSVVAAGEPEDVRRRSEPDETVERSRAVLLPGLVNAHAHLDLSTLGRRDFDGDLIRWLSAVRSLRPAEPTAVAEAVRQGAEASRREGVLTVGDIAGSPAAVAALRRASLRGVSYAELFGRGEVSLAERLRTGGWPTPGTRDGGVQLGLQPHAPYSCGAAMYRAAADAAAGGVPVCTHLAESPEELQFVRSGEGPFRAMLQALGKWPDGETGGGAAHPVAWLDGVAGGAPWLGAHCNYAGADEMRAMAYRGWSVAYCPRATEYFGHGPHPYRPMLEAGIHVCLGTDSVLCHGSFSILEEMRRLHRRDGTDALLLLKMATTHGMRALRAAPAEATFTPGATPGVIAVTSEEPAALETSLRATSPPAVEVLEDARPAASVGLEGT